MKGTQQNKPWAVLRVSRKQYCAKKPWKSMNMTREKFEKLILDLPEEFFQELFYITDTEKLIEGIFGNLEASDKKS